MPTKKQTEDNEDNSVDLDNEAYIGTSPEYRNSAYDINAPSLSEDEDVKALEQAAKEREVAIEEAEPGFRGYVTNTPHPTEATTPSSKTIEDNRLVGAAALTDAKAAATSNDGTDTPADGEGTQEGDTPFGG
jgi:hypothetical protein